MPNKDVKNSKKNQSKKNELKETLKYTSPLALNGDFIPFSQRLMVKELDEHPGSCNILAYEYLYRKLSVDDVNQNKVYEMSKPGVPYPIIVGDNFTPRDLNAIYICSDEKKIDDLTLEDLKLGNTNFTTPICLQIYNNKKEERSFYYVDRVDHEGKLSYTEITSCFISEDSILSGMITCFDDINYDDTAKKMILEEISKTHPDYFSTPTSISSKLQKNIKENGGEYDTINVSFDQNNAHANIILDQFIEKILKSSGGIIKTDFDVYHNQKRINSSGHSVAFSVHSNGVSFFDPNRGEIIFKNKEHFKNWFKDEVLNHTLRYMSPHNIPIKIIEVFPVPIARKNDPVIYTDLHKKNSSLLERRKEISAITTMIELETYTNASKNAPNTKQKKQNKKR